MKMRKLLLALVAVVLTVVSCGPKKEAQKKVLVLYYTQTSNTKTVAQEIATRMGADIEEIVPVMPYDGDFKSTIDRCMEEREEGIVPEIKPITADISQYDLIFIGYPVWFGTFAPPVGAFLDQVDLSGKKVVPFCTFGSGGLESSAAYLAQAQPKAKILDGYGVRAARMDAMPKEVDQFLKASGFLKGKVVKLDDFSASHRVNNDEAAIYDAAIGDYPMMQNTRPLFVASRSIPDGTEYLFTACEKRK